VNALLPSWILFPAMQWLVAAIEARAGTIGLAALVGVGYLLELIRVLAGLLSSTYVQSFFFFHNYYWPPAAMSDFLLGVLAATIARRHLSFNPRTPAWAGRLSYRGLFSDLLAAGFLVLVLVLPISVGYNTQARQQAASSSFSLIVVLFMASSVADGQAGIAAAALAHPALAALGDYAFAVYLLQIPVRRLFERFVQAIDSASGPLVYFLVLLVVSALYTELIEKPTVEGFFRALKIAVGRVRSDR